MKTQAIVPTAGTGTRLNIKEHKPFIFLKKRPIIVYTLKALEKSHLIDSIILVVHQKKFNEFRALISKFRIKKIKKIIVGGNTRFESVENGLKNLDADTEIVLIHDGVRPFISDKIISDAIKECKKAKAAVVAVAVKDTIKSSKNNNMTVKATLDRRTLWQIQTPQVFKKEVILKAYSANKTDNPTDDAVLVENIGVDVRIVKGDYRNIKITTKEDLLIAEAFLKNGR